MKAFSLIELIIVILVIAIITSFSINRFEKIDENKNFIKLKSQFAFIQSSLEKEKQKRLLNSNLTKLTVLDEAKFLKVNEKLFLNILEKPILSTNDKIKESGMWLKLDKNKYAFILNHKTTANFSFKEGFFKCISEEKICKALE